MAEFDEIYKYCEDYIRQYDRMMTKIRDDKILTDEQIADRMYSVTTTTAYLGIKHLSRLDLTHEYLKCSQKEIEKIILIKISEKILKVIELND
jgi:hypothetical protein